MILYSHTFANPANVWGTRLVSHEPPPAMTYQTNP